MKLTTAMFAILSAATVFADGVLPKDDWCWVDDDGDQSFLIGMPVCSDPDAYFSVDSGSAATVSVSGLPSGVKFNAKTRTFSGAPSKRGVYYVTCSAKNKNGYAHSVTREWNVGDADNGDYDNIGLEGVLGEEALESLLNMWTGEPLDLCTLTDSITGLPPGVKFQKTKCDKNGPCAACFGFVTGMPTKPGKYKLTFADAVKRKAVLTVVVRDSGCQYVDFVSPEPSKGTASGSKVYAAGAKAKMSAKAKPGYVFAGWYWDKDFDDPFCNDAPWNTDSGDWRKASDSFAVGPWGNCEIYARFVPKSDDEIWIDAGDAWEVCTGCGGDTCDIYVESCSLPTVTAKGLPAGVKWDSKGMRLVADSAKVKPGRTLATLTAKNASGNVATHQIEIIVPNIESYAFDEIDYSPDAYNLMLGVSDACVDGWLSFCYDSDWKVTASGLPSGLRLDTSYSSGWTQYATVRGTPTKAGSYTVTLTAKSGSLTERATITINVEPLPPETVGTFNGVLEDANGGGIIGTFTFTASANGKQSAKVVTADGTWSLSGNSWNCYDGSFYAYLTKSSSKEDVTLSLQLDPGAGWHTARQLDGEFRVSRNNGNGYPICGLQYFVDATVVYAQRNPFTKTKGVYDNPEAAGWAEKLSQDYKARKMVLSRNDDNGFDLACRECVDWYDGSGIATLTVDKSGTAKISGKLYDYYSFSATVPLMFDVPGYGCFAVFCPIVKTEGVVPIIWKP